MEVKGKRLQKIKETVISEPGWNERHWATLVHNYSKAPFFREEKDWLEELYLKTTDTYLSRVNLRFLKAICDRLGIITHLSWSMDYMLMDGKTERLVSLCKQAHTTEYLSGPSAQGYMEEELFNQEGIAVRYMDYSNYPEYPQLFPPFVHQVSVLDLILNTGSCCRAAFFDLLTMDLSIVTSLYYSAPYLEEFYRRSCASAEKISRDFEFVLVNDGSPDHSLAVAIALHEKDSRVRVIDLSRNFGHHKAIMTGLMHAQGDLVFMLDCDLGGATRNYGYVS